MFICLYVYKRVDINTVIYCYASGSIERRTQELSNATLHMKQDTNSIEKKTPKLQSRLELQLKTYLRQIQREVLLCP